MKQILLLLIVFISSTVFGQDQWSFIGSFDNIYAFYDADNFIYLEDNFNVQITSDGGVSSETSNYEPWLSPFLKGHYVNQDVIMMVQQDGPGVINLLKSTNGGMDFTEMGTILPEEYSFNSLMHIHFYTENTGIIHTRTVFEGDVTDIILKTEDGGNSWSLATDPSFTDSTVEMDFFGAAGMRLYRDSDVQESTDLGENWTELGSHPLIVNGQFASQGGKIWGVGNGGADNPCNTLSIDGGVTYTEWNIPDFASGGFDGCGERIASMEPNNLVVTGHENGQSNEVTLYSTDGGETFSTITFPDDEDHSLEQVYVTDNGSTYIFQTWNWFYSFTPGQSPNSMTETETVQKVQAFPNPSTNRVFQFTEKLDGITVHNQAGQLVFDSHEQIEELDLTGLERGIYFASSKNQHFKLIVE